MGTEWPGGLTTHPERQVRRGRRITGRDDALVIDARQRLIGEQAPHGVGGEAAAAARSGTPNPAVQIVTSLGSVRRREFDRVTSYRDHPGVGALDYGDPSFASRLATERRPRGCR